VRSGRHPPLPGSGATRDLVAETGIDPLVFREILGHYPTGVCVIAAMTAGGPQGLSVGSFTSVSLAPPLVGFFPAKSSTTWPRIEAAGRFSVNVLAHDQEHVCRALASSGGEKFAALEWMIGPHGHPHIGGALAWIDCSLEAVHEAGDHYAVIARVHRLEAGGGAIPLVFFRGAYGGFAPHAERL
jgi:3-hydroxy-9,10-secoandrosta-1,3,5(10)-triene-9,17-dione monooxygenase reductase component